MEQMFDQHVLNRSNHTTYLRRILRLTSLAAPRMVRCLESPTARKGLQLSLFCVAAMAVSKRLSGRAAKRVLWLLKSGNGYLLLQTNSRAVG